MNKNSFVLHWIKETNENNDDDDDNAGAYDDDKDDDDDDNADAYDTDDVDDDDVDDDHLWDATGDVGVEVEIFLDRRHEDEL